jgi:hypothetical protein
MVSGEEKCYLLKKKIPFTSSIVKYFVRGGLFHCVLLKQLMLVTKPYVKIWHVPPTVPDK